LTEFFSKKNFIFSNKAKFKPQHSVAIKVER